MSTISASVLDCYNYDFELVSSDKTVEGPRWSLLSIPYYSAASFTRSPIATTSFYKTPGVVASSLPRHEKRNTASQRHHRVSIWGSNSINAPFLPQSDPSTKKKIIGERRVVCVLY